MACIMSNSLGSIHMRKRGRAFFALTLFFISFPFLSEANARNKYTTTAKANTYEWKNQTVIGNPSWHDVRREDTLLDMARENRLGINEMTDLYPDMDPWLPPEGERLMIPTFWVLPSKRESGIVINLTELRLYFFKKDRIHVQTYPCGIGREGLETPLGSFFVTAKQKNPTWYIPKSLQKEYGMAAMPPGPDNPLGSHKMKFSAGAYAIHGTHMAWGVGRLVSHGCIRTYPEHIKIIYPQVKIGTRVQIIYEPIKFGKRDDLVYVEVHPDLYNRIEDFKKYALEKLAGSKLSAVIDPVAYEMAVELKRGIPTNVTIPEKIVSSEASPEGQKEKGEAKIHSQKPEIKIKELKID
ncbi:L,D-transpeptidase [Thermodesulfobacteriota bacterium]